MSFTVSRFPAFVNCPYAEVINAVQIYKVAAVPTRKCLLLMLSVVGGPAMVTSKAEVLRTLRPICVLMELLQCSIKPLLISAWHFSQLLPGHYHWACWGWCCWGWLHQCWRYLDSFLRGPKQIQAVVSTCGLGPDAGIH